ncbi:hypothetical protein M3Y95_00407100 [Aphelenchoides besseyi]|nr:hypothetical protein M3Y95_00407100 [Aphelenchoides besseyi]
MNEYNDLSNGVHEDEQDGVSDVEYDGNYETSRMMTSMPTNEFEAHKEMRRRKQLESEVAATTGLQIFDLPLVTVADSSFKNLVNMFAEVERRIDADLMSIFNLLEIIHRYGLRKFLNLNKFVSLFQKFRPQWKLSIGADYVQFSRTERKPIDGFEMVKMFVDERQIKSRRFGLNSAALGQIVGVGEEATIFIRPMDQDHKKFSTRMRSYSKMLLKEPKSNDDDTLIVLFVGDCVLWLQKHSKMLERCQVMKVMPNRCLELLFIDSGHRAYVSPDSGSFYKMPLKLRQFPPSVYAFESIGRNGQRAPAELADKLRTVAKSLMNSSCRCVFSFTRRTPLSTVLDLYGGVWKPIAKLK